MARDISGEEPITNMFSGGVENCDCECSHHDRDRDPLTGAYSREGFIRAARAIVDNDGRAGIFVILYFNIKGFKAVNSIFGFGGGDKVLVQAAEKIKGSALNPLAIARCDSDHFVVLARKKSLDMERLADDLSLMYSDGSREAAIYAECGVYVIDDPSLSIGRIVDRARSALLFREDKGSSNPVAVYSQDRERAFLDRSWVVGNFERALANGEFCIYCQPIVDARSLQVASAEALIRWIHPDRGMISPGVFIPALEETGLISKLSEYIVGITHSFQHQRYEAGLNAVPISVNLSWTDFYDLSLMNMIFDELHAKDEPAHLFRFEITETSYAALERNNGDLLRRLQDSGAKILLDDFGSGYSSFSTLSAYEFDILKLDIGFIRRVERDERDRKIVRSIISMAHDLGMKVVAEGVETQGQADYLRSSGCDYFQGYLYYKPMPMEDFAKVLSE